MSKGILAVVIIFSIVGGVGVFFVIYLIKIKCFPSESTTTGEEAAGATGGEGREGTGEVNVNNAENIQQEKLKESLESGNALKESEEI